MALAQQLALTPLVGSRWGRLGSYEVDYTGLVPAHMNQVAYLLRAVEESPAHLRLLQMAAVKNVVARHEAPFQDLRPVAVIPGLFEAPIRVFEVPDPSPHAFVAASTRIGEGLPGAALLVSPQFDFRREALVPAAAPAAHGTTPGTARVVSARPDRLQIDVDAPDGGYLVVLETYDPGWRATVDGAAAAVVPANILFRGIAVAPGRHAVEMIYRPPGLVAGLWVSLVAMLSALWVAWRTARPGAGASAVRP